LGYSPFLDSALIQFDKQILLTTPHILALPLNEVFLTLFIDGHRYAAFFHRWVGAAFSGRAFFPVAESYKG